MTKQNLQVKFSKSVAELEGPFGDFSRVYTAPDGDAFLIAAESQDRSTRFHFHKGDIGGAFPSEKVRQKYMDTINRAAGEVVVVPAEAA